MPDLSGDIVKVSESQKSKTAIELVQNKGMSYSSTLSPRRGIKMNENAPSMESILEDKAMTTCRPIEVRESKISNYKVVVPTVVNSGASLVQAASFVSRRAPRIRRISGSGSAVSFSDNSSRQEQPQTPVVNKFSDSAVIADLAQKSTMRHNNSSTKSNEQDQFHQRSSVIHSTNFSHSNLVSSPQQPNLNRYNDRVKLPSRRTTVVPLDNNRVNEIPSMSEPEYIVSPRLSNLINKFCSNRSWSRSRQDDTTTQPTMFTCLLQNGIYSHNDTVYPIDLCSYALSTSGHAITSLHLQPLEMLLYDKSSSQDIELSSWCCHLVAGGAAGAVSRTCTAPLDRLKVLRMVGGTKTSSYSMLSMFRHMLREGGVASMWRGNAINIAKVVPESALKFAVYEQVKNALKSTSKSKSGSSKQELGVKERLVAGSCAGFISQSVIYPMEVVKTTMVLRTTGQYSGLFDCVCRLIKTSGVRGLYRGYVPNVIGIIPYSGIDLTVYETLKRYCKTKPQLTSSSGNEPLTVVLLSCGIVSSTCGQLVTYPLSLVRTRLQAQVTLSGESHRSMLQEFLHIYKSDGVKGFYRGAAANFLKVAPAVGISYAVYENVRSVLGATMT